MTIVKSYVKILLMRVKYRIEDEKNADREDTTGQKTKRMLTAAKTKIHFKLPSHY